MLKFNVQSYVDENGGRIVVVLHIDHDFVIHG